MFTKIQADQFFHQHRAKIIMASPSLATMTASTTAAIRTTSISASTATAGTTNTIAHRIKESRNKSNNRYKHINNNNNHHHKIENQSHINGHNSNISKLNHSNLSNNKQQQHHNHTHEQRHHLVRHHHNDPNAIARRQHHEHKQKRRQHLNQQQQQQQRERVRTTATSPNTKITTTYKPTPTTSSRETLTTFIRRAPSTTYATKLRNSTAVTTTNSIRQKSSKQSTPSKPRNKTTLATTTTPTMITTVKGNRHKGRKRKFELTHKKQAHHKQRLLHKLQKQRKQQVRSNDTTTATVSTTTQFNTDWANSENWWANFTDEYNNNTYNNNSDYGSNEWLSIDPSPASFLLRLSTFTANDVSESEESSGYYSSSTTRKDFEPVKLYKNNKKKDHQQKSIIRTTMEASKTSVPPSYSSSTYETSLGTDVLDSNSSEDWSSTTSITEFDNNHDNESSETDTETSQVWASATPIFQLSNTYTPTTAQTKVHAIKAHKVDVIETTTSTNDNDNSTFLFDLFTDVDVNNSSDHLLTSVSDVLDGEFNETGATTPLEASSVPTVDSFKIKKQATTNNYATTVATRKHQSSRTITKKISRVGNRHGNKFVRKFASAAANSAVATTELRLRNVSPTFSEYWSTTPPPTTHRPFNKISNIIQINKNFSHAHINNTLSDKSDTSTRRASSSTMPTTKSEKTVRKSTQKLMATPFHQLIQYVRNDAGEIDIDNIDNIRVYPELSEESDVSFDADYNGAHTERSKVKPSRRLSIVKGYLPTLASAVLPESIQIAKKKIKKERTRMLRERRRHSGGRIA